MKNNTSLGYIDIWSFIHLIAGYLFTKLLLRTKLPKNLVIIISVIGHQVFEIFEFLNKMFQHIFVYLYC